MQAKPYLEEIAFRRDDVPRFEEYPFNIAAVRKLDVLSFHPDVTFLVGENGTGKSTLIEAVAILMGFGPEGGTRNVQFATAETVGAL
jgi:predicted ATPase